MRHVFAASTQGSPWFDVLPFHDRPLFRYSDGRVVVTTTHLLMEKEGFDISGWLTDGPARDPKVRARQEAFGRPFECYTLNILN